MLPADDIEERSWSSIYRFKGIDDAVRFVVSNSLQCFWLEIMIRKKGGDTIKCFFITKEKEGTFSLFRTPTAGAKRICCGSLKNELISRHCAFGDLVIILVWRLVIILAYKCEWVSGLCNKFSLSLFLCGKTVFDFFQLLSVAFTVKRRQMARSFQNSTSPALTSSMLISLLRSTHSKCCACTSLVRRSCFWVGWICDAGTLTVARTDSNWISNTFLSYLFTSWPVHILCRRHRRILQQ